MVGESDLDDAFDKVESSIQNIPGDLGLSGIASGLGVAEISPTANLTLNISGPGVAYDSLGQRLFVSATQNVDMSTDENGTGTAVATPGNEKWLSIFLAFDRSLADPRLDGNSATVFYERNESFSINVAQGGEASTGTATRPPIRPNEILLADVLIVNGQTQIVNGDIDVSRRQDLLTFQGVAVDIRGDNLQQAFNEFGQALDDHIAAGVAHTAVQITYAGGDAWNDGDTNPAGTVESALDDIFTGLSGTAGSDKIGAVANAGSPIALSTGSIQDQLREIQSQANSQLNTNTSNISTLQTDLDIAEDTLLRLNKVRAAKLWRVRTSRDNWSTQLSNAGRPALVWDPFSDFYLLLTSQHAPLDQVYATRDGHQEIVVSDGFENPWTSFTQTPATAATDGAGTVLVTDGLSRPWFNTTPGDYRDWTQITNNDSASCLFVGYHNGQWILSRTTDSTTVETTPTLSATPTWTTRALSTVDITNRFGLYASNGSTFLLGIDDTLDFSTDLIAWNDSTGGLPLGVTIRKLIWWPDGNVFVAATSGNSTGIFTSSDGNNNWTDATTNLPYWAAGLNFEARDLATDGHSLFVFVESPKGYTVVMQTTDLVNWTLVDSISELSVNTNIATSNTPNNALALGSDSSTEFKYFYSQRIDD